MRTIKATAAKQNFGGCLMSVAGGPVIIEKSGKPAAVMISFDEYERFVELENMILMQQARQAMDEGFLNEEDSATWVASMNARFTANSNCETELAEG